MKRPQTIEDFNRRFYAVKLVDPDGVHFDTIYAGHNLQPEDMGKGAYDLLGDRKAFTDLVVAAIYKRAIQRESFLPKQDTETDK